MSDDYALFEIAERDDWACHICGKGVPRVLIRGRFGIHPLAPTIDHVVPLSKGGPDMRANVKLAHFGCNSSKGNRTPDIEQLSFPLAS
ncbi:MAG: HNH endonuclease [Polyangiales bacterium]